jgi:3-phenylpropionate/trans-cinnamate dioxygenase ferredoxin component
MSTWVAVASADEIESGTARVVEAGQKRIALCKVDGECYAIDDVCTHDGGPLGEGTLVGDRIECPRHGALFDVKTGKAVTLPAIDPVQSYPVRVVDGTVEVEIE